MTIKRSDSDAAAAAKNRAATRSFMSERGLKVAPWCDKAGISEGTLRAFLSENTQTMTIDKIQKLAAAEHVTVDELLGNRPAARRVLIRGAVGAGGNVRPIDDLPPLINPISEEDIDSINGQFVDAPPGFDPDQVIALRVTGTSMLPYMRPGSIVYYAERFMGGAPAECIDRQCVVQLSDGETLLKIVRKSHLHGKFDLVSYNMDQSKLSGLHKGETTYAEAVQKLGKPTQVMTTDDGKRSAVYSYVSTQARPESFIPYVGIFVGGADTESTTVVLTFDSDDILLGYSSSQGSMGVGTGFEAYSQQRNSEQPNIVK